MESLKPARDRLLRPVQVIWLFKAAGLNVSASTLRYWAATGKITFTRTVGGHRRYHESAARSLLRAMTTPAQVAA